jgi:hypothetical protein
MMKHLIIILIGLLSLTACDKDEVRMVDVRGDVKNLTSPSIYVTYHRGDGDLVHDTVVANDNGTFHFQLETSEEIAPVMIYFNHRKKWTTLFAKSGDEVTVKGDLDYVDLLSIRGGEVNDDLDEFKQIIRLLYKERLDLLYSEPSEILAQHRLSEIDALLKQKAREFITDKPSSLASVVLIQDFFYQDYDPLTKELVTQLRGIARKSQMAEDIRNGIIKWK